jgi:short-subunit dehydrogenase
MSGFELAGSRGLITGASSGIGRELAEELGARGAKLTISARRRDLLESLADEITLAGGPTPTIIVVDLSERGAAEALATQAEEALGQVDLLVNNAGGGVGGRICAVGDRDEAREAFEINYWSPLALIKALVPAMAERGHGAVVNVGSLAYVSTWPWFGGYASTKGALSTATETLALELSHTGVDVLEVLPGPIDTAVQGETRLAPGIERMLGRVPMGDPAKLARRIVRALERGKSRVIYPRATKMAYLFPALVRWDTRHRVSRAAEEIEEAERGELGSMVIRTGSTGDPLAREAREAWERQRGRAPT